MRHTIPQPIRCALQKKRLIFTVTTGRSGTGYLSEMLRFLPSVASYHEPEPKFSHVMRTVQSDRESAYAFWIERKLPWIANERGPIYIETSHLFCKGFVEALLDLDMMPDLIVLSRPWRQVAMSLYELNTIPGRTPDGLTFLLSPDDPSVLPLPGWEGLHDYQLCYWYCVEIARRMNRYKEFFLQNNARVVDTSTGEITTAEGMQNLIEGLDLPRPDAPAWRAYLENRQKKINTKRQAKDRGAREKVQDIDDLEKELLVRVQADFLKTADRG